MKNIFKCIGWSILYLVITFVVQFGFMVMGISKGIANEEILNQFAINNNLLLTIFSNIVVIIILGFVLIIKKKKIKDEIKKNSIKYNKKLYVFLILIAFLYSMLFLMITYKVSFDGTNDMIISMNYFNSKNKFLGIMLYVSSILIFAPIAEELLCREIMINELNKIFSEKKSIIISAVVFGIMHLMAGGITLAVGAVIIGIILGIVYTTTKSLRNTILVHSVANFSDIILLFISKANNNSLIVFSILIAILLSIVLLLAYKNRKVKM